MSKIAIGSVQTISAMTKNIEPDEEGYYTQIIGGLNMFNSAGEYYIHTPEVEALFKQGSFHRQLVISAALYGEAGHPKLEPGMTTEEYIRRIRKVYENNIAVHFKEIWLEKTNKYEKGFNRPIYLIWGKVKPFGKNGLIVKDALETPSVNSAFSIRSFTKNYKENGVTFKELKYIVTFDFVVEPGIRFANKVNSVAMEDIEDVVVDTDNEEEVEMIKQVMAETMPSGMESFKDEDIKEINGIFDCGDKCIFNW